MAQQVVTELVIDSSRAVSGAADYTRAMDGAQSAMQRSLGAMSDAVSEVRDGIASMGQAATNVIPSFGSMAVGVGAAVAVVLALSKAAQEFAHDLADMGSAARRAGTDVESFQKLQFGASLEGLSNKDFSSGIEKMAMRLNDAGRNENELSKLLDANNVKFKDANGILISTNSLLDKGRDLISRGANEQDKIKMADMLGLTKQWVPFLDKSAQDFAAIQNEASALGLVIDKDIIARAKTFDDEWRKSSAVFSTWMKAQIADLLPLVEDLIAKASLFGKSVMDAFASATNSPQAQEFAKNAARAAEVMNQMPEDAGLDDRVQIAALAAKALAGALSDVTKAQLDQDIAIRANAKMWNDIATGWENAAAAGQHLIKNIPSPTGGAANDNTNRSVVPGKDTPDTKDALDRAIDSIKRQTEAWNAEAQAQGLGTQAMEEYKTVANLVSAAERAGIDVTGKLGEKFNDLAVEAGKWKNANEIAIALDMAQFDAKTALLSPLEKEIALLQKKNGINPQTEEIAGLKRTTEAITQARDASVQFTTSLVDGLMSGKSLTDSLKSAFDGLAKSMANSAIKDLFSGQWEKAAVETVVAIGAKLLGGVFDDSAQKELKKAQEAWAGMKDQMDAFIRASDGFDLNPIVSAIVTIKQTADQLFIAAMKAGDTAGAMQVAWAFVTQVNQQITKFSNPQIGASDTLKQITDLQVGSNQLIGELQQIGRYSAEAGASIQNGVTAQIIALKQAANDNVIADINAATGKGFITDLTNLFAKIAELQKEQIVSPDLIQNDLVAEAQKIVDGAGLAGDAFNQLIAQFPQLTGLVHESTDALKQQADAQKQLQDSLNQTAGSIVDYINGLVSGPQSTLSPTAVLANAQSVYNANLALAQGGDQGAQAKFVSLADNLEKAARAVYASGQAYQDIRNQIIAQGLTLPAVQATTDPVVAALRDAITEIQVRGINTVGAIATMQGTLATAMNSGNPAAVALALSTYFDTLNTTADQGLTFSELVAGVTGLSRDTTTAGLLTQAQIDSLGFSKETTVGQLLTQPQLAALGLSTDAQVSALDTGNLLRIFQELDGNGNGILEKSELIKAATQGTQGNTGDGLTPLNQARDALNVAVANLGAVIDRFNTNNALLTAIQGLQTSASQQLALLNANFGASVTGGNFNFNNTNAGNNLFLSGSAIDELRKITYNTAVIAGNTKYGAGNAATQLGVFATGGTLAPFQTGIFGEHHPSGPWMIQAGAQPMPISPSMPSFAGANDNGALLAEMRRLGDRVERIMSAVGAAIVNAETKTGKEVADSIVGALSNMEARRSADARQERTNPRRAA